MEDCNNLLPHPTPLLLRDARVGERQACKTTAAFDEEWMVSVTRLQLSLQPRVSGCGNDLVA